MTSREARRKKYIALLRSRWLISTPAGLPVHSPQQTSAWIVPGRRAPFAGPPQPQIQLRLCPTFLGSGPQCSRCHHQMGQQSIPLISRLLSRIDKSWIPEPAVAAVAVEGRPDLVPEDSPSHRLGLTHVTTLWSVRLDRAVTVPATSYRLNLNGDFGQRKSEIQIFFWNFHFLVKKIGMSFKTKNVPDGHDLGRRSHGVLPYHRRV